MATNTAASFSTPTANGTAGPFNIGFTYLAQSEIDVTVNGDLKTLGTHYIFHSTTQISFTSGNFPTVGQTIKFQRNTDISAKKVDFQDGSVLTETDLDNNTDQILFGLQEFTDELNNNTVKKDAGLAQITDAAALAALTDTEVQILDGATISTSELNTLDGVNNTLTASELNTLDGITASTAELNQLTNKEIETSLTANSDAKIPTSKAVNDRILTVTNALGGFVAIANETSFPSTHPDPSGNAGTVVSISDAGGVVINGSGVATIANGAGSGNTVTITSFPSDLHSRTLGSGVGLQVQTTSTLHTYTYHKSLIKESDLVNFSADLDSFRSRYRVVDTTPTSNNDEGDLIFRKSDNKLLVYNGTAYQEASSVGNFHTNTLSTFNGTGGNSATFNGVAYRFNIDHPPELAEQLLVSINGIIQKPNSGTSQPSEGFALSGSSVIFSAAPASGSDFFIITIGKSVDIGNTSDGVITNVKVASDASIEGTKINPNFGSQNILTSGLVDGRDISADGTKLDGIESNAINASNTAITNKLSLAGGTLTGTLNIQNSTPSIKFTDTSANPNYFIKNDNGSFIIQDATGDNNRLTIATNGDITITGDLQVQRVGTATNNPFQIIVGGFVRLHCDTSGNIRIPSDNKKLQIGASQDLNLSHDGSSSYITNNTGFLFVQSNDLALRSQGQENFLVAAANGSVELYYDNVKKFETTSAGATVTDGTLIIDNDADSPNTSFGVAEALRIDDSGVTQDRGLSIYEYHQSGARFFSLNYNLESTSNGSAYVYTQGLYSGSTMLQIGANDFRFFVDAQVSSGSTDAITPTERFRIDTGGARVTGAVSATAINVCHLKSDTTASVTSTAAVINFNQESTTDTNKFSHSGGEITVLTTGWYAVKANVTYQSAASSRRNTIKTEIQKNGTSITSAEKYTFIQSDIKPIATAHVNGGGTVIKQNGGFSSITRTNFGRYTLNFTNAMADDDYQVFGQIIEGDTRDDIKIHIVDSQQTTSDFDVAIYEGDNSSTADVLRDRDFYIQVLDTNTAWGRYGQASIDTFVYLTANDVIRIRTQQIDEEGTTTILGASSEFFVKAEV